MANINVGTTTLILFEKHKKMFLNDDMLNESTANSYVNDTNKLLNLIFESPILKKELTFINNIQNKYIDNDVLASRYIDDNINLFEIYTINEVFDERKKLNEFYDSNIFDEIKNTNQYLLYEAIDNLIVESLKPHEEVNVDVLHESFNVVLNHIKTPKNKKEEINESIQNLDEEIVKIAVDKYNEEFSKLTTEDKEFIKKLINTDDDKKKELFEEEKKECLNLLEMIEESHLVSRKEKAIEKVNLMEYDHNKINDQLIDLYDLKRGLV